MLQALSKEEKAERCEELWRVLERGSLVDFIIPGPYISYGLILSKNEKAGTAYVIPLDKRRVEVLLSGTLPTSIEVKKSDLVNVLN